MVDDFGIKYVGKEHADHLIAILEEFYVVEKDWEGIKYCGITLDWDYDKRQVHLSIPGYCQETLTHFCHELQKIKNRPHKHTVPAYGANNQYAKEDDKSTKIGAMDKLFNQ